MSEIEQELKKALTELRKNEKRKFEQSVDLIINLQKFDIKKTSINTFIAVPHKIKDKKVCGFFEIRNNKVETITRGEFKKYSDKKELKKLVNKFDFFMAEAALMPQVATVFGRALGPAGKMPSPQLGILMDVNDKTVADVVEKIDKSIKLRAKEPSIKIVIGKEGMKDEDIIENIMVIYNAVLKLLPRNKENVKNIEIKFTMTKPQKIIIK